MADALRLQQALPLTPELLETGELLRRQAFTVLKRTGHCTVEIARQVEAAVLADPAARAPTPGALGKGRRCPGCPAPAGRRARRRATRSGTCS